MLADRHGKPIISYSLVLHIYDRQIMIKLGLNQRWAQAPRLKNRSQYFQIVCRYLVVVLSLLLFHVISRNWRKIIIWQMPTISLSLANKVDERINSFLGAARRGTSHCKMHKRNKNKIKKAPNHRRVNKFPNVHDGASQFKTFALELYSI